MVFLGLVFSFQGFLCCCRFVLSVPWPSDWLERLVPEMTCFVSSGTLNSTHSLTHFGRMYKKRLDTRAEIRCIPSLVMVIWRNQLSHLYHTHIIWMLYTLFIVGLLPNPTDLYVLTNIVKVSSKMTVMSVYILPMNYDKICW